MIEAVACVGLTRRFSSRRLDPVTAVDGVDLNVRPGEFVAIEGPSGSGKTTLLALLAGIDQPDSGVVRVLGHDLARLSAVERAHLRRSSVGVVFQSFGLLASLSAGENVALPLDLAGRDRVESRERADAALAAVGLGHVMTARIDELSAGERQRVGVARALVSEPQVVFADEPAGRLDDDTAGQVIGLLAGACRERGASLVLVTHDAATARLADRCLGMTDGRVSEAVLA
jgi:putative ABC transport system ATP-binding protein